MDPETAQEHIDAAVAEAERAAEIAIADLRATHEDEIATRDAEIARLFGRFADERVMADALRQELDRAQGDAATLRQQLAAAEIAAYERGRADTNAELAPLRLLADALLDRVIEPIAEREENLFKSVAQVSVYVSPEKADAVVATLRHMADVTGMHLDRPDLESMRPVQEALHALILARGGDCIEYHPGRIDSPPLLRLGCASIFGINADDLFAALRSAALEFTDDKED